MGTARRLSSEGVERQPRTPAPTGTPLTEDTRNGLYMFRFLLVFTAALESFAHGANDTANASFVW